MLGLSCPCLRRIIWTPRNTVLVHRYTTGVPPVVVAGVHSLTANSSPEDLDATRAWIEDFRSFALRREDVRLSFARSSGPGGQVGSVLLMTYWLVVLTHKYYSRM